MTGKTIAFVHGAFVTRHCWDRWIRRFEARGYACVALSYPGRDRPVAELRAARDDAVLGALTLQQVVDHLARELRALDEKPLLVGHSFGGLITQLLLQRDLAAGGVAITSVPPQGVPSLKWSFLRCLWPVLNPFVPASKPYLMPFEHFRYAFANDLAPAEQRAAHEAEVVPESRRFARGALTSAARVDFGRARAPLLMIAGGRDHIMPASLNRRNFRRYAKSPSVTDFELLPDRAHYSVLSGRGWEAVADLALDWAVRRELLRPPATAAPGTRRAAGVQV